MILIPKYRDIEIPMKVNRPKFSGHYVLHIRGADGRVRKVAEFDNIITTNGANLLGSGSPLLTCAVGSGNRTPVITDTALQTLVGSTTSVQSHTTTNSGASPYFGANTTTYNFTAGTATGNLAEVGVGNTASSLFSRALILDGGGSPTTITVLSSEALFVTYQLNQYVPLTDVTGSITIAGVSYGYTLRASSATSVGNWAYINGDAGGIETNSPTVYNGAIGAITGTPSGTSASGSTIANSSYSANSFTLSSTVTFGISAGNLAGGITAASVQWGLGGSRGSYQMGFGTAIPKDNTKVLTLSLNTSWTINSP